MWEFLWKREVCHKCPLVRWKKFFFFTKKEDGRNFVKNERWKWLTLLGFRSFLGKQSGGNWESQAWQQANGGGRKQKTDYRNLRMRIWWHFFIIISVFLLTSTGIGFSRYSGDSHSLWMSSSWGETEKEFILALRSLDMEKNVKLSEPV